MGLKKKNELTGPPEEIAFERVTSPFFRTVRQMGGLAYKHALLRIVYWKTTLFTILYSVACLALMVGLKFLLEALLGDRLSGSETKVRIPGTKWDNLTANLILEPYVVANLVAGEKAYEASFNKTAKFRESTRSTGMTGPASIVPFTVNSDNAADIDLLGYLQSPTNHSGDFARLSQTMMWLNVSKQYAIRFQRDVSDKEIDLKMVSALQQKASKVNPFFGALHFKKYNPGDKKIHYTVQYDKNTASQQATAVAGFGGAKFLSQTLMNYVNNMYFANRTNNQLVVQSHVVQMPYTLKSFSLDIIGQIGVFIFPMILCTLVPTFTYTIVLEKVEKLREMQRLMGMSMPIYYLIVYISQYSLYLVSAVAFAIICYIFDFGFISRNNWVINVLTLGGWGFTTVSFSFLLSSVINDTLIASVAGYLLVLFGPIAGVILEQFVIPADNAWPYFPLLFVYPLQLNHATIAQVRACNTGSCPGYENIVTDPFVLQSLIAIYGSAVLYMALAVYLNAVLPQAWGVRKHPLLCLGPLINRATRKIKSKLIKGTKTAYDEENTEKSNIDEDVIEESRKVHVGEYTPENTGVLFDGLVKKFGKKKAVKGIQFAIKQRECFGLLGPNGAGKTTTISMLCGLIPVSEGTAYIIGNDIRDNMSKIHRSMGLCPQFDVLWNDLTCYQHLRYYCFLKGVPLKAMDNHIQNLLHKVGLWKKDRNGKIENIYSRKAGNLSGGMKRRLSIAIALCGNPDVILLDEPTTGLDPATKRSLWNLILEVKQDRCVILTTHSLEEADILSDRIGIMSLGQLKCVGSSLHLKNKFGDGYKISINFDEENRTEATKFLTNLLPNARPVDVFAGRAAYEIKRELFSVGDTFIKMEEEGKEHHIREFAVNQTSLEDVFLNIISQDDIGH